MSKKKRNIGTLGKALSTAGVTTDKIRGQENSRHESARKFAELLCVHVSAMVQNRMGHKIVPNHSPTECFKTARFSTTLSFKDIQESSSFWRDQISQQFIKYLVGLVTPCDWIALAPSDTIGGFLCETSGPPIRVSFVSGGLIEITVEVLVTGVPALAAAA